MLGIYAKQNAAAAKLVNVGNLDIIWLSTTAPEFIYY